MIRKNTNGDISDEEFEAILKPFIDDYDNFGDDEFINESSGAEITGAADEEFNGEISDDFKQLFDVIE